MSDQRTRTRRIPVVNTLRALAIAMVVYQHGFCAWLCSLTPSKWVFSAGWTGVNLFFILSGFVLAIPYLSNERQFASRKDIFYFYKHRFKRLYPLFLFTTVIFWCFSSGVPNAKELLLTLSGMTQFVPKQFFPHINEVLWSLMVEFDFCLFFPLFIFGLTRKTITFSCFVFAVAVLTRIYGTYYYDWSINKDMNPIKDCFFGRWDDFLVGMLVAKAWIKGDLNKLPAISLLFVGFASLFLGCVGWNYYGATSWSLLPVILPFAFQIGFVSLLISLLCLQESKFVMVYLCPPWIQYIGTICYSIYIFHLKILEHILPTDSFTSLIKYMGVLGILTFITARFIEFRKVEKMSALISAGA